MDVDGNNDMLAKVAAGEMLELDAWPALQIDILARLEKIAHTEFAIPDLPPPHELRRSLDNGEHSSSSPLPQSSSQEADKENVPVPADGDAKDGEKKSDEDKQPKEATTTGDDKVTVMEKVDEASTEKPDGEATAQTDAQTGAETAAGNVPSESIAAEENSSTPKLPVQIAAMLSEIKSHIQTFTQAPPHTLQRLAELVLHPRAHYRALATYLHAVDRVVQVTSGLNTYPLPPAIPDMSSMHINGVDGSEDPASLVSWNNPTTTYSSSSAAVAVGSDEALGGALLTPIPWLTRRSPDSGDAASTSSGGGSTAGGSGSGAQIHSEGTETIDGPNGMGSIETVSVSVNGVPSTGHARGVTQGELLRQEQRAGVVPVSQLSRNVGHPQHAMQHHQLPSQHEPGASGEGSDEEDGDADDESRPMDEDRPGPSEAGGDEDEDEEEEVPHARGPDEIGVNDTGPQTATTSSMGESGLEMQGIDLAAAVGRPAEEEEHHAAAAQVTQTTEENEETAQKEESAEEASKEAAEAPPSPEGTRTKREAEDLAEGEPAKKLKEE
ncbi:hypothetical protein LMH87_006536 [Akanthomyces muscarius]|uniref:Protein phosphatase 4 core regulatory subunit R2 n=1 Tax=Akanthomyces muscarius TaxID=2231603 RepID=A0A9W8QRC5_AKAMU|nr:hypothetical protein LMH87_006536 [Akanthomyces muscarius]KAJ4164882.1 hypothetical protein LMH87_006536 [Akanthomyces muscarius]